MMITVTCQLTEWTSVCTCEIVCGLNAFGTYLTKQSKLVVSVVKKNYK